MRVCLNLFKNILSTHHLFDDKAGQFIEKLVADQERLWLIIKNDLAWIDYRSAHPSLHAVNLPGYQGVDLASLYIANDQHLWFGDINGTYRLNQQFSRPRAPLPPVAIRRLSSLSPKSLTSWINFSQPIKLPANTKQVGVSLALSNYLNSDKNLYRFRKQGDPSWSAWQSNAEVILPDVSLGDNHFGFQARDGIGRISPITQLHFMQTPPWYWQPFAIVAWVLSFTILFTFIYYWLLKRRLAKANAINAQLQTAVDERTATITAQNRRLAALDQAKTDFFCNITHEIRTPLTLSIGALELLGKRLNISEAMEDQTALKQWQSALDNNQRLLSLVNQILDLNRYFEVEVSFEGRAANLQKVITTTCDRFKAFAESENIEFSIHLPKQPLTAMLNWEQMDRVLSNLLINAFKYTPAWGRIEVRLNEQDKHALIEVSDTGVGIADDKLPLIFDRFFTNNTSHRSNTQSTGIGLALVKQLVTLHGGEVDVQHNSPSGLRFIITLPLSDQAISVSSSLELETTTNISEINAFLQSQAPVDSHKNLALSTENQQIKNDNVIDDERKTILIIDDNNEIRELIAMIFSNTFNVIEASDGKIGLSQTSHYLPDLIICDLMMPNMDGKAFAKALKQDPELNYIPLIMLTASFSANDEDTLLRLHADDYIQKPFATERLRQKVVNRINAQYRLIDHITKHQAHEQQVNQAEHGEKTRINDVSMEKSKKSKMPDAEANPEESSDQKPISDWLNEARAVIKQDLAGIQSVNQLAEALSLERSSLYRKIQREANVSPQTFLRDVKLEVARDQLLQSDDKITAIAYHCGFSSLSYFSRAFKDRYGLTPNQYKTNHNS